MRSFVGVVRGTLLGWGLAGGVMLALACSSKSSGLGDGDDGTGDGGSGGSGGSSGGNGSSGANGGSSSASFGGSTSGGGMGTGTCQTGVYSGMFSCLFYYDSDAGIDNAPDAGGIGPITGTLSFNLTQDVTSTGELSTTDTASGVFNATTGGFLAAQADLSGTLDCESGNFTGQLLKGEYGFNLGGGVPLPDPNNMFQGPLVSDYSGASSTFVNGRWSMYIAGEGPCIGSWSANYTGPIEAGADAGNSTDATTD
jgi:hypothetical protein